MQSKSKDYYKLRAKLILAEIEKAMPEKAARLRKSIEVPFYNEQLCKKICDEYDKAKGIKSSTKNSQKTIRAYTADNEHRIIAINEAEHSSQARKSILKVALKDPAQAKGLLALRISGHNAGRGKEVDTLIGNMSANVKSAIYR